MTKLRETDYKILCELIKNSKASDRQLARKIGVSQPTVTRRRARLEKEVIDSYTAIPNWPKLGYNLIVITLVKARMEALTKKTYEPTRMRGIEFFDKKSNVIMAGTCQGPRADFFMISIHKNYSEYDTFIRKYRLEWTDFIQDLEFVLVNLAGGEIMKPLSMECLEESKLLFGT
ncbi:MAG: winged helix-turn-helix transcriptional regulator [Candidatus Bathyarchaeota archaeon]|nr:MAG: winged helix-turn-helix transcriptional regulator [Candidatus Bathyarchaeota archaeon]